MNIVEGPSPNDTATKRMPLHSNPSHSRRCPDAGSPEAGQPPESAAAAHDDAELEKEKQRLRLLGAISFPGEDRHTVPQGAAAASGMQPNLDSAQENINHALAQVDDQQLWEACAPQSVKDILRKVEEREQELLSGSQSDDEKERPRKRFATRAAIECSKRIRDIMGSDDDSGEDF